ncbi:alpha amylase [Phlyctema vagabunda]|uniref:alpha-amylase n=1 Tax=Phlyctema vagabunda TaxID=108571 RepID=A0ABR4PP73_9HELO
MGFTAIWISPVVEQVSDGSRGYHGYSAVNFNALNDNFGTPDDLTELAEALHDRGMYLMVDVVANHMAYDGTAETVGYSGLQPFDEEKYYHNVCWINDYDDQTDVEQCWLGTDSYPLPDLDTTSTEVRDMFSTWVEGFVANYSIDGLRIDTVKHVEKEFWPIFNSASGVFNLGELADGNVDYFCPYQDYMDGLLDYPSYYQATQFFSNVTKTSENFVNQLLALNTTCKDSTLLGTFSENHDQPRFASYTQDVTLAKNILTYTMLADGIPIIYQGQEQHYSGATDPYNREAVWFSRYSTQGELYDTVQNLNLIRARAVNQSTEYLTSRTETVYSDDHTVVFRKGGSAKHMVLMVVSNLGADARDTTLTLPAAGFPKKTKLTDVVNCKHVQVDKHGGLEVEIKDGLPMVFYPRSLVKGSKLCGGKDSAAPRALAVPLFTTLALWVALCVYSAVSL